MINNTVKYINFDYFLSRALILEAGKGRPSKGLGINSVSINAAYDTLRKNIKEKHPTLGSSSVDLIIFRYIANQIYDLLTDEEQAEYDNVKKSRMVYVPFMASLVNGLLERGVDENEITQSLLDKEDFFNFMDVLMANKGSRAKGKDTQFQTSTQIPYEEFVELTKQLAPVILKMNTLMAARKSSITKLGDRSKYNQKSSKETEKLDPNVQNAIGISNILSRISTLRSALRQSGELDNREKASLWATQDENYKLKQLIKGVSDKEFDSTVSLLMDLLEVKIDAGTGQTTEGFLKLVDKIKAYPSISKPLLGLFDHIVGEIQSGNTGDLYQSIDDEINLEGYDRDVINSVLPDPDDQALFSRWLSAHKAWREEINKKYEERFEKKSLNAFLSSDRMNNDMQQEPNTPEDSTPEMKENVEYDSGLLYMENQFNKDLKFKPAPVKFAERKFKKFKNYDHWLSINES